MGLNGHLLRDLGTCGSQLIVGDPARQHHIFSEALDRPSAQKKISDWGARHQGYSPEDHLHSFDALSM